MDRQTRRLVEGFRHSSAAGPLENNLIDELVSGELDRQEFLQRATHVRPLARHDRRSCSRYAGDGGRRPRRDRRPCKAGGTIRVGLTGGGSLEPYLLNDGGALALSGIPGEYLTFTEPEGPGRAVARHELEAEQGRDRVGRSSSARASSSTTARR